MTHVELGRELHQQVVEGTVTLEGGGAAPVFIEIADDRGGFWVVSDETETGAWQLDHYPNVVQRERWVPDWSRQLPLRLDAVALAAEIRNLILRAGMPAPDFEADRVKRVAAIDD
jgi:hypothetical protein